MIVDLSVEDNRRIPVVTQDRLIPALQIDDLQAYRAQRRFAAFEYALLVRSAMRYRLRNPLGNSLAGVLIPSCKSRDSTHLGLIPRSPHKSPSKTSGFVPKYTTYRQSTTSPLAWPFGLFPGLLCASSAFSAPLR